MQELKLAAISAALQRNWVAACRQRLPMETCGVLFGHRDGNLLRVDDYAVIRNAAAEPATSFSFDPADWIRVWYAAERSGKSIVGIFHSHPDGTSYPSAKDTAGRLQEGTYWIIGLTGQTAEIAVYSPDSKTVWRKIALALE